MKESNAATAQQGRSQRVHRGTNRPSGKSVRTTTYKLLPSTNIMKCSVSNAEFMLYAPPPFNVTVATTISATRSAIQSSDLRQKITAPRVKQKNAEASVSARVKVA
jgi:hypothetical protein